MNRQEGIHPAVKIAAALDPRKKKSQRWLPNNDVTACFFNEIYNEIATMAAKQRCKCMLFQRNLQLTLLQKTLQIGENNQFA